MEEDREVEEEETPRSPFWLQTTTNVSRLHRYRRRLSSLFFNSVVFIIFLLFFALLSMVFIIPSFIQFPHHIFRPNLLKKSWDSINLILVLIALAFGFLARNINNDEKLSLDNGFDRNEPELLSGEAPTMSPVSSTPRQWYDFQDQSVNSAIGLRRQRTSSSYPDLRELSPPRNHRGEDNRRFSDDTHLHYYRVLESNRNYLRQRSRLEYHSETQNSFLYTPALQPPSPEEGLYFPPAKPAHLPVPPPPYTAAVKKKTKSIYINVGAEYGEGSRKILLPVIDPVPEPSSPAVVSPATERKRNGGYATKEFFTSFYNKKKKKRQRDRSVDNLYSRPPAVRFQQPPPPPSVQHNSFPPKREKQKKIIAVTRAPPTPPPPPPLRRTKLRPPPPTITRVAPFMTDKPRVPLNASSFTTIDDSSSGGDSPMKQIPPPPPLPPFTMPDWKFAVEGDFVRFQSTLSSRSVSPDGDEAHSPSSDVEAPAVAVAPIPDVDIKADSFIARFRAGLKLEKSNYLNQAQGIGMSKLGPGPGPNDC